MNTFNHVAILHTHNWQELIRSIKLDLSMWRVPAHRNEKHVRNCGILRQICVKLLPFSLCLTFSSSSIFTFNDLIKKRVCIASGINLDAVYSTGILSSTICVDLSTIQRNSEIIRVCMGKKVLYSVELKLNWF